MGQAHYEMHTQVIRALWTARAFRPPGSIHNATSDTKRQGSGGKKGREERKRGRALINTSYKNAEVHNLHELETESRNRYALSHSSFYSVYSLSFSFDSPFTGYNAEHNG